MNEVLKALREGKPLPVERLSLKQYMFAESTGVYRAGAAEKSYDLRGIPLEKSVLRGLDLRFVHLEGALLDSANLQGANLQGANLQHAKLREASLQKAYLAHANLQHAKLEEANLQDAELAHANLQHAKLEEANLQDAYLAHANLQHAKLEEANLQDAELNWANLQHAKLEEANLQDAELNWAKLQKTNLDSANLQGAELKWARLQGAELKWARLQKADLWSANLDSADLRGANLQGANLRGDSLQGAKLMMAILDSADLRGANLQGANLGEAKLQKANLREANLQDANFFQARFDRTHLRLVNLGEARNIRYIIWGDSLNRRYFIAMESSLGSPLDYRIAEDTYRDLRDFYTEVGSAEIASEFHFRMNEVRTKSYRSYHPLRILRLLFLKWTYGYGSRPTWLFWYSIIVISVFATVFALLTLPTTTVSGIYVVQSDTSKKKERLLAFRKGGLFPDCLYFSLLSFATFGHGALKPRQWLELFRLKPVEYKPVGWARIFVGIEAALGIYLLALLATVLFGRR